MDIIRFDNDITVLFVPASSFPDGIQRAHSDLHRIVAQTENRRFFGISRPERNQIRYKAAAEELAVGEGYALGLDTLTLKKGDYYCITVFNFMKNISGIGEAFERILQQPGIDQDGYCVEWYFNGIDVHCMVRKEG